MEEALTEMYLARVSIRRAEDITEALWDTRVSPSTVSELNPEDLRADQDLAPLADRHGAVLPLRASMLTCHRETLAPTRVFLRMGPDNFGRV